MDLTLNSAVLGVELSGIRRFTFQVRDTPGACALTIGEPDLNTPDVVKEAAKAALDANDTHYPPGNGYPYMLEALSRFEAEHHGLHYSPDEIILTIGATEGLFLSLSTVLNPGDEVIIPTPAFSLYESITRLCRGVPVALPTEDNAFQIDPEKLKAAITPKTKAVILTSPNNPTGCIYDHESLTAVYDAAKDRPMFVLCDEVYRDLIYTDSFESFHQFSDLRSRIIGVQSFSKPYAMTGWRVGYLMADRPVKEQLEKIHQYNVVSISSFVQRACAAALAYDISSERQVYRRRRDYVCTRLDGMGLPYFKPQGAFYVFPSIAAFGMDSLSFCSRLVKEGKLACTPGSCFGAEGFLRISYCYSDDVLREGMNRLERFVQTLRRC